MKKIILFCTIALFFTFSLISAPLMAIIPLSSPLYDYIDALYTMEGMAAPQGARPWTEADLKQQLDRVRPSSDAARNIYKVIDEYLNRYGDMGIAKAGINLALDPVAAAHTTPSSFSTGDHWVKQDLNSKLIKLNLSLYISDYFAADMGASVGFRDASGMFGTNGTTGEYRLIKNTTEARFSDAFATNIPFVSKGSIDLDFTDNSFMSVGTPYVSLAIARSQLSWGNGKMGNMMLSNNLPYHDYLSISASNNTWFDYSMVISFFTHPMNYYQRFTDPIHGLQMFIGHRFEFRFFQDKMRFTLNEGLMYQSDVNTFDFRAVSPLLILHGLYIPANGNSLMTFEFEYAPIKNLQLYVTAALDDISVGEAKAPEADATLNMWGLSGGARGTIPYSSGYFSMNLEIVYTSPLMYHKDSYSTSDQMNYALDFVGTVRLNDGSYKREYLSYPFGSDAFAVFLGSAYTVPYHWSAGLRLFFMAHGITNVNSIEEKYDGSGQSVPGFLMTENPFTGEKGEISYTYDVGLDGEYYFFKNLKLSTSLDFLYVVNFNNMQTNAFDMQWTLALNYSIF